MDKKLFSFLAGSRGALASFEPAMGFTFLFFRLKTGISSTFS